LNESQEIILDTEIDMSLLETTENIIKGQSYQEFQKRIGPYSLIIRTPLKPRIGYSYIIFCYNNDDLGVY